MRLQAEIKRGRHMVFCSFLRNFRLRPALPKRSLLWQRVITTQSSENEVGKTAVSERKPLLSRVILLAILMCSTQLLARADDFGMIVKNIEKHYNAKQRKIPFMGLAGFAVKLVHPAGVKSVKFALFQDQDFSPGQRDRNFEQAFSSSLSSKWKPLVRSNDRSSGDRVYFYTHGSGKDIEVLSVTFSRNLAIVAQAKVNPEAMSRFIDKPELLGMSLAGSVTGSPVPSDQSGWDLGASRVDSNGPSISDIATTTNLPASDPRTKPTLSRRSDESPELNPVSGEPAAPPEPKPDKDAIRLEARLINLNVKAVDRGGRELSTLTKDDFRIFEDGVEQNIFYFEPVSAPINVVLLLDLSGSTNDSRKLMVETAKRFIDSLGAGDRVAVAAFTRRFFLLSDFSNDKNKLKDAVERAKKIQGGTAFYDAMWETFDLLRRFKDSRKAIVVLTDGVDNSLLDSQYEPTNHSFDELLERVDEEDATIYPIYFNPEETKLLKELNEPTTDFRRARLERRLKPNVTAHRQIEKLASESAGAVFVAESEGDIEAVYQRVAAELRLMYTLAYAPKNSTHDGKYRKIEVAVKRDGAIVKTRRGYLAK